MNKIYIILAIGIVLSVIMQIASATENKEYTCIDKAVKSPPPTLNILNIEEDKTEPLCPEGKVPKSIDIDKIDIEKNITNIINEDIIDNRKMLDQSISSFCVSGYCYDWARSVQYVNNYGVAAYLTQHNPEVVDIGIHSKAMVSVADSALNQIATGWRKGSYDSSPKLFVLWWRNGVPQGYYYGWRQFSNIYYPGMTVVQVGASKPYMIQFFNGDWWIAYNGEWMGYYPGGIFKTPFDMANFAVYLGEVMRDELQYPCIYCFYTDMGNGHWASNPNAAKIYDQKYKSAVGYQLWVNAQTTKSATSSNLYTVQSTGSSSMRYGGPGLGGSSITPSITVTRPNGGETFIRSTSTMLYAYSVEWRYNGQPGPNVRVELYKGGVYNKVLTSSTSIGSGGKGYYIWGIPSSQTIGADYKIKITSTSNSAYSDLSNNYFTIGTGLITVSSPNGGESWAKGSTHAITWSKTGSTGSYVKIELLKGGVLNRVISSGTLNDGSYSWAIPSTQTIGTDYKIRITSTSNSIYKDSSNNNFKIY